jgi:uncharacterized repeat protein (TIGR03803 family)
MEKKMYFEICGHYSERISRVAIAALAITLFTSLTMTLPAFAQTETVLYSFCPKGGWCSGGAAPDSLIADSAGNLYGTTYYGGTGVGGVAFTMTPAGEESLLYTFTRVPYNGWAPEGLTLDNQGNLYGTTSKGGTNSIHFRVGDGTAFKLSPDGTETTLYNFGAYKTDGAQPFAGMVLDTNGNLYGTTYWGGIYTFDTVFRLTPDGVETVLHNFANDSTDGGNPAATLIRDKYGNLYGTTQAGGSSGAGTVFELTAAGSYKILHNFDGVQGDGVLPIGSLTLDSRGNLYGATFGGGGTNGTGTVFKLTPGSNGSWTETILYKFNQQTGSCQNPYSNVLLDAKGNLYGTTINGGASGGGCAYEISAAGKLTILHSFGGGNDGSGPGSIVFFQGNLYGTTFGGGENSEGTAFKITP